jgi:hypothetical protein
MLSALASNRSAVMTSDSDNTAREPEQRREKLAVKIKCPKCGQIGSATWEENAEMSPKGPMSQLLSVSSGFYQRAVKTDRGAIETACDACETVVPD